MPTEPRPAASLILLRPGDRGLEVLLVRRGDDARFMPGVWVFPGGVVEDGDRAGDGGGGEELAHRACAIRELREEAGVELPAGAELVAWSRWITPEVVPVRFDTRFYVALAPPHCAPEPDAEEVSDAGWFAPAAALEQHRRGALELVFPTIKHLESLVPYASAAEALTAGRGRAVEPVLPRVVGTREDHRIVLPGEPDY